MSPPSFPPTGASAPDLVGPVSFLNWPVAGPRSTRRHRQRPVHPRPPRDRPSSRVPRSGNLARPSADREGAPRAGDRGGPRPPQAHGGGPARVQLGRLPACLSLGGRAGGLAPSARWRSVRVGNAARPVPPSAGQSSVEGGRQGPVVLRSGSELAATSTRTSSSAACTGSDATRSPSTYAACSPNRHCTMWSERSTSGSLSRRRT